MFPQVSNILTAQARENQNEMVSDIERLIG